MFRSIMNIFRGFLGAGSGSRSGAFGRILGGMAGHRWTLGQQHGFANRAWQQRISHLQSLGLTPQEIMGGGGGGGASLGNGAGLAQGMAAEAQAEQSKLWAIVELMKSENQLKGIQYSADASSGVGQERNRIDALRLEMEEARNDVLNKLDTSRRKEIVAEGIRLQQKFDIEKPMFEPAWHMMMKVSTMSADNLRATAIYAYWQQQGIDLINQKTGRPLTADEFFEIINSLGAEGSRLLQGYRGILKIIQQNLPHVGQNYGTPDLRRMFWKLLKDFGEDTKYPYNTGDQPGTFGTAGGRPRDYVGLPRQ